MMSTEMAFEIMREAPLPVNQWNEADNAIYRHGSNSGGITVLKLENCIVLYWEASTSVITPPADP